jgi:hypothetical protein
MSSGFLATNDSNQVLISSDTRNLHFIGKATHIGTNKAFNDYMGLGNPIYRINCSVVPVPFFTMPTLSANVKYGIASINQVSAGVWDISLIKSGNPYEVPEVYIFADPRGVSARDSNYGMLVLNSDNTPSFDSRLSPLAVTGGGNVYPPSNPLVVTSTSLSAYNCGSGTDGTAFNPTNAIGFSIPIGSPSKPIYSFYSLAQAERSFYFEAYADECDGFNLYGACVGASRAYFWSSFYWAFYRSGIGITPDSIYGGAALSCGWITADYGCVWDYRKRSSFLGIGTGRSSGSAGRWPYSNETINLNPSPVLIADGSRYD